MTPTELRAWRDGHHLSRRDAAEILGLNPRTLEDLEYGRAPNSALWGVLARLIPMLPVGGGIKKPAPGHPGAGL